MIKFEIKKMLREKSMIILFFFFLLILIIPLFTLNSNQSFKFDQYKNRLEDNEKFLEEVKNDPKAKNVRSEAEQENVYFKQALKALKTNDDDALVTAEYNLELSLFDSMKHGSLVGIPEKEQKKRMNELDYLISHKIKQVDYTTNKIPAINYIYYVLSNFLPYMYFLFVSFIVIVNFSTFEKRRKTIDFFNVSPLSTAKKLLSKIISTSLYSLLLIYISFLIAFIFFALKNGVGNVDYPIPIITEHGNVEIITIVTFIFQALILFSLLIIFFSLLSFLLSLFTGNSIIHLFVLVSLVFVSGFNLTSSKYSITNLMNFPNIVARGTAYTPLPNSEITFGFSAIVITVYIVLISILIFITLKSKKGTI